jgi:hypothetical protein
MNVDALTEQIMELTALAVQQDRKRVLEALALYRAELGRGGLDDRTKHAIGVTLDFVQRVIEKPVG